MALLPILRVGGMQLFRSESSEKGEKELRSAGGHAVAPLAVYLLLLMLAAAVYRIGGMNSFGAVTHAMTTVSTGGHSNYDASFGPFASAFLQWAAVVFMLAGALPFMWYGRIVTRRRLHSEQVAAFIKSVTLIILLMSALLAVRNDVPILEALRLVAFNVVSVVTTTGFAAAFFFLAASGGCTGSTAGGAKAMRCLLTFRALSERIRALPYPNRVFVMRYEGKPVSDDILSDVMSFFGLYFLTVFVFAILLSLEGLDLATATGGALTAVANVGPGIGPIIGPSGNFATLPDMAKLLLALGMYIGRLEFLTIYVLFLPVFWRAV